MRIGAVRRLRRRGATAFVTITAVLATLLGFADPSGADDYGSNTAYTTLGSTAIDRGILPNNRNHTYCVDHVAPGFVDNVHAAMGNLDVQTNMTVQFLGSCNPALNGGRVPDVDWYVGDTVFQDLRQWFIDNFGLDIGDLPDSWGITLCKAPFGIQLIDVNGRVCNSSVAVVPTDRIAAGVDPAYFDFHVSNILCHELGHTVGLEHHNTGPGMEYNPSDSPSEYAQDGPLDWGCTEGPDFSSCQGDPGCIADEFEAKLRYHPHHVDHINGYLSCRALWYTPADCDTFEDSRQRTG
jgi:hypothetical protein